MKKLITLVLIGALAASFTACSSTSGNKPSDSSAVSSSAASSGSGTESNAEEQSQADKVIFEKNGVKVTYKGIEDGLVTQKIKLKVENNSKKDYVVQSEDLSVNDCMLTSLFSLTVNKGKSAVGEVEYGISDLEENNIKKTEKVEFKLTFSNPDTFETDFESEMLKIDVK